MGLNQHIVIEFALQNLPSADSFGGFLQRTAYLAVLPNNGKPLFLEIFGEFGAASLNVTLPLGGAGYSPFFANISFLFLFLAMTVYWFDLVFSFLPRPEAFEGKRQKSPIMDPPIGESVADTKEKVGPAPLGAGFLGKSAVLLANLSLISLLCIRWQESGHFPLSNLYESLMFLSWSCTFILIFLIYNNSAVSSNNLSAAGGLVPFYAGKLPFKAGSLYNSNNFIEKLLGSVLAPCALLLNSFATFSLPKEMQQAGPLVPALQSNWLMMHVTVMIISYAALILGSLLSIAFLIYIKVFNSKVFLSKGQRPFKKSIPINQVKNVNNLSFSASTDKPLNFYYSNPPEEETPMAIGATDSKKASPPTVDLQKGLNLNLASYLDYLSYRIIGIGFPFLTIGILSGAVWANEAWGSYWSWDPKETWALLTWLIFAIYLHTRLTKGWEGERPAIIASLGFVVVWICYLGVNLLGEGLHSYGFFK